MTTVAAWKLWIALFVVCAITFAILGFSSRLPFQPILILQMAAVIACLLTVVAPSVVPGLQVCWPWTDRLNAWRNEVAREEWAAGDIGQWFAAPRTLLSEGQEIPPPWNMEFDNAMLGPMSGAWRQGHGESWIKEIWYPFWHGLQDDERRNYLDRWDAPELWRSYLEPGRESSTATHAEKSSIAGHITNAWLK